MYNNMIISAWNLTRIFVIYYFKKSLNVINF